MGAPVTPDDLTTAPPPGRYLQIPTGWTKVVDSLKLAILLCIRIICCVVFLPIMIIGLIAIVAFPFTLIYIFTIAGPPATFDVQNVLVSISNVTNNTQVVDFEWNLKLSVHNNYWFSYEEYPYVHVSVECLGENSTLAAVSPPLRHEGCSDTYLKMTTNTLLPKFKIASLKLPFKVHIQSLVKYRSWSYFSYSQDFTDVWCKDTELNILSCGRQGITSGGPFTCY